MPGHKLKIEPPVMIANVVERKVRGGCASIRDESGFGFGASTAENPKPLWSR
jgi:hypothetical protein